VPGQELPAQVVVVGVEGDAGIGVGGGDAGVDGQRPRLTRAVGPLAEGRAFEVDPLARGVVLVLDLAVERRRAGLADAIDDEKDALVVVVRELARVPAIGAGDGAGAADGDALEAYLLKQRGGLLTATNGPSFPGNRALLR
jgi:hypothetical protein